MFSTRRWKRVLIFGIGLMLPLTACVNHSIGDSGNGSLTAKDQLVKASTVSCQNFVNRLQKDFANQSGTFYDYVTVPENPADPQSPMIHVFYFGRLVPGQTPVVFFNGGPVDDSHSSYSVLTQKQQMDSEWSQIPFIFMDQRGTGCSDPYPQGNTDDVLRRLSFYGGRGIVADAEAIRQALHLNQWKVFGQSYGAFLVHRYMVLAPQSIVAAYAHADAITSDPMQRLTGRILSQNRVIQDYLKDFPTDLPVLQKLNSSLTSTLCFWDSTGQSKICGFQTLAPALNVLGFIDQWPGLHMRFNLLVHDGIFDVTRMQEYLNQYYFISVPPGHSAWMADNVIGWVDRNVSVLNTTNCQAVYANLTKTGESPQNYLFDECSAAIQGDLDFTYSDQINTHIEQTMKQDLLTIVDFKKALLDHPQIPFYLYSGEKDPYVPEDDFKEELTAVSSLVHYTHFLDTGHDGFYTEPQVWEDLLKN